MTNTTTQHQINQPGEPASGLNLKLEIETLSRALGHGNRAGSHPRDYRCQGTGIRGGEADERVRISLLGDEARALARLVGSPVFGELDETARFALVSLAVQVSGNQ